MREFIEKGNMRMSRFGRYEYNFKRLLRKIFKNSYALLRLRDKTIDEIAGQHPDTNPFHHQWAMNRQLMAFAKKYLSNIPKSASILDVGVGSAPYWHIRPDLNWKGLDVDPGEKVDFLIKKDCPWQIQDNSFDVVLCTQVIEHVENPSFLVSEINRVLKPGGQVILNAPFLYPFHGMPDDQMRYTTTQLEYLFKDFNVSECGVLGGVGSSLATIYLNFINYTLSSNTFLQILKLILLPIWLVGNAVSNILLVSLDKIDDTKSFPLNTYLIATVRQ
jgi:SAM-dependent methyltransferase